MLVGTRLVGLQKARPETLAIFKPVRVGRSAAKDLRRRGTSFPSGHTTDNFAALAVLVALFRWRGLWYLVPASLVAYSRIYVGKHWPSDILASMLLGVISALLILGFLRWLAQRAGVSIA